jgi:hypothetical protein
MSDTTHATATSGPAPTPTAAATTPPTSDRSLRAFRIFSYCIAALLLTTAILKVHMLIADPFVEIRTEYPIWILWVAVLVESSVVGVIVFGKNTELKYLALAGLFVVFLVASMLNVILGNKTCGCTGVLSIPPLGLLLFNNLVTVFLAAAVRFDAKLRRELISYVARNWKNIGCTMLAYLLGFIAIFGLHSRNLQAAITRETNGPISARSINVGDVNSNFKTIVLKVENNSRQSVRIIGAAISCTCVTASRMPRFVPDMGYVEIEIRLTPKTSGRFHERIKIYLDHEHQFDLTADIVGNFNF